MSSFSHRGGMNEPYCSQACYGQAGRAIAALSMGGASGLCMFCNTKVAPFKLSIMRLPDQQGGGDGVKGIGFYLGGQPAFCCQGCVGQLQDLIATAKECFCCGSSWHQPKDPQRFQSGATKAGNKQPASQGTGSGAGALDMIRFTCSHCHKHLRAKPGTEGKQIRCPNPACAKPITVPSAEGPQAKVQEVSTATTSRIKSALKAWYRRKATAWWSSTLRRDGACDDCNGDLKYGDGYLRPGNYLCCERCTDRLLDSTEWERAMPDIEGYFGPNVPEHIRRLAQHNDQTQPISVAKRIRPEANSFEKTLAFILIIAVFATGIGYMESHEQMTWVVWVCCLIAAVALALLICSIRYPAFSERIATWMNSASTSAEEQRGEHWEDNHT